MVCQREELGVRKSELPGPGNNIHEHPSLPPPQREVDGMGFGLCVQIDYRGKDFARASELRGCGDGRGVSGD